MTWWSLVGGAVAVLAAIAAAYFARVATRAAKVSCTSVQKLSSTSSALVELAELRDAVGRLSKLGKRIEMRERMSERRTAEPEQQQHLDLKAELRRQAGIVPGRYPKHSA